MKLDHQTIVAIAALVGITIQLGFWLLVVYSLLKYVGLVP